MCVNATSNPLLQIAPFAPTHQADTRNLILQSLGEHRGWIDEKINTRKFSNQEAKKLARIG
jgi:hypothetical protein